MLPNTADVPIALYDMLGRRVATVVDETQEAGRKQQAIPGDNLSNGVHFLRLRANDTVKSRKLVVVKEWGADSSHRPGPRLPPLTSQQAHNRLAALGR